MGKRKWSIEKINEWLKENRPGGKCLETKYINRSSKMSWKCEKDHQWKTSWGSIHSNHWCNICALSKMWDRIGRTTINNVRKHINIHHFGSICLSKEYINNKHKLDFICEKGHHFKKSFSKIKNSNEWCTKCGNKRKGSKHRFSIKDIIEYIEIHFPGAKCLSKEYTNAHTKLKFQCKRGHIWTSDFACIKYNNVWCQKCKNFFKGEKLCRIYFEIIFQKPFPKIRPYWLINLETIRRMELDGFNQELKVAFEYQGRQHYEVIANRKQNYIKIKNRDQWKRSLCKKNNITLIEIPYTVKFKDMGQFIIRECRKKGINPPMNLWEVKKINWKKFELY